MIREQFVEIAEDMYEAYLILPADHKKHVDRAAENLARDFIAGEYVAAAEAAAMRLCLLKILGTSLAMIPARPHMILEKGKFTILMRKLMALITLHVMGFTVDS